MFAVVDNAIQVSDPTGYQFLIKQGARRDPLSALMYYVNNIDNSIK